MCRPTLRVAYQFLYVRTACYCLKIFSSWTAAGTGMTATEIPYFFMSKTVILTAGRGGGEVCWTHNACSKQRHLSSLSMRAILV